MIKINTNTKSMREINKKTEKILVTNMFIHQLLRVPFSHYILEKYCLNIVAIKSIFIIMI